MHAIRRGRCSGKYRPRRPDLAAVLIETAPGEFLTLREIKVAAVQSVVERLTERGEKAVVKKTARILRIDETTVRYLLTRGELGDEIAPYYPSAAKIPVVRSAAAGVVEEK